MDAGAQGIRMPNLLNSTMQLLQVINEAAKKSGATAYLHGELALSYSSDRKPANNCLVQMVLSVGEDFDINDFYRRLSKSIVINKEVANTAEKYHVVSFPYVLEFSLRRDFDPRNNDIATFSSEQNFINLDTKAEIQSDHLIRCLVEDWDISHIVGFAHQIGTWQDRPIDPSQKIRLADIDLLNLSTPDGWDVAENVVELLTTAYPGNAFEFLVSLKSGREWLAQRMLDISAKYEISLNEEVDLYNLITPKKIELLNIYSEFFRFKHADDPTKRHHAILTYLKLMLDAPSLEVNAPYIDRVSVLTNPVTLYSAEALPEVQLFANGACCQSDGSCVETTEAFCRLLRGTFFAGDLCADVDCTPDIPGDCQYPPCPECDPEACGSVENGGQPCCCCSSVDIVSASLLQCHKQIIISCNRDGTGPGPDDLGIEQHFGDCAVCEEVCAMIINSAGPQGCTNPPDPTLPKICCGELPSPWYLEPPTPCECDCARYDADNVCSLHCMSCSGVHSYCRSVVSVRGGDCAYSFDIAPGPECCGSPAGFDVIFAIDNSGSMGSEIDSVKAGIESFVDLGEARGIISRMGLIWFNNRTGNDSDIYVHGWNADGTLNQKLGQSIYNYAAPILPGPVDYTTNVTAFKDALDTPLQGGNEDGLAAAAFAFNHGFPGAFGNVLVLVSDEIWPNNGSYIVSPQQVVAQANLLNYKIFYVGTANGNEQVAIQTGGNFYPIDANWTQIFEDISAAAGIFPSSCACVDFTPIPILRDVGDPSDPDNYYPQCDCPNPFDCLSGTPGELPAECYEFPIAKCIAPNTEADCEGICDIPFDVNVCGTTITVTPTETNLTCCGSLELGCECPTGGGECPDYICCGAQCPWVDICDELAIPFPVPNYPTVEAAQSDVWNQCVDLSTGSCGDECLEFPTGECEEDGTTPIPYFVTKAVLDQEVADAYNNCGGTGGACCVGLECSLVNSESECDGIWQGIGSTCTPNPCGAPGAVEFDCVTSECDYDDQCIVGSPNISGENRIQDQCSQINDGCSNVRNPAIVLLNNGVGIVAYEAMADNITSIKLQQFHTSVDFKLLSNRIFGYGRLQNKIKWEQLDNPVGVSVATVWSYNELPLDIIQGTSDPSDTDSWQDVVVFGSGPLAGGCFPVYAADPAGYDDDKLAWYVKILIQTDSDLTSPFLTSDDVYNIRWYIYDYQTALRDASGGINNEYLNLIGGAGSSGQSYPNASALIPDSKRVDNLLVGDQITHHIYNGERVPVANPSLSATKNYQSEYENAHYINMTYQALEDGKWNIYLKQIRASEYSRSQQINDAISSGELIPIVNAANDPTPGLGLTDVIYRVVCVSDNCSDIGEFLLQRTVVMEATLSGGREVLNPNMPTGNWGSLCPGVVSEMFPKKKVFIRFVQSAVGDRCPDQFQFDSIFQNWSAGQDYVVPISVNSAQQLLLYITRANDEGIDVGQFDPPIEQGGTLISSSSVGAEWYDAFDKSTNNWSVLTGDAADTLSRFKGFDIGEAILISVEETGHATHPVIQTDYDNHIFIAYEHTNSGTQQIKLVGTKEPYDELPTGVASPFNPDNSVNYFFSQNDFVYSTDITNSSEGTNQLPDLHVDLNNVLHLVWQSNRDRVWEIYYGNSSNNFLAKRITKHDGRSMKPRITSNAAGNLFITWHDNREGNYEIYMAYHPGIRTIPLYQQDPYLASLRNFHEGWSHTTNVLPLLIENEKDGPICFTKFDVNFYEDRNLERLAFTVSSDKFPFAFSLPGSESDVTIVDLSDLHTSWITTSNYDYSGDTIVQENFVATSIEIDTYLDDSSIKNIQLPELNVSGGCSFGSIQLRASNVANDPDASTQWTAEYSLINKEGALIDLEEIGVTEEVQGRYKQIRLKWSCTVSTEIYSILDGESDADVENNLIWENNRLEVRIGLDPVGKPAWGEVALPSEAGGPSFVTGKHNIDVVEVSGILYVVWYLNSLSTGTKLDAGELNITTGAISNVTTVFTSGSSTINGMSIEDIDGYLAIAYSTTTIASPQISKAYFAINRGTWENNVIIPAVTNNSVGYPVLISHNNNPGVFISVSSIGSVNLNYYRSTTYGQSWSNESLTSTLDAAAEYSGAIIANTPAVTYRDTSVSYRVYKTRSGGSWGSSIAMTISGVSPNATRCSLVDNSGNALFFYKSTQRRMNWAQYDGSTWTGNQTVDLFALEGFWKSAVINNTPSIAYMVDAGLPQVDIRWAKLNDLETNFWDIETIASNVESTESRWDTSIAEWDTNKAAIIPFTYNPILYLEDFDVSSVKRYDTYLRFGNFDVPKDSTIVSSHIELTSRTASNEASAIIRLLDEYNARVFEDNTTVIVPIQANSDDAELKLPDIWNVGSNSIRFGNDGTQYNAYLRFPLTIPANSKVIESYITLTAADNNSGNVGSYIALVDGSLGFADTYVYSVSIDGQTSDADYSTSSDRWNNERWDNDNETIRFGESGNETYESYLRFFIQGIPDYAVISSAVISLEAANTEVSASDIKIKLLDYGDIDPFPGTTVLQFQVDASADDADFETGAERWLNNGSSIRFGINGSDVYDSYMKFHLDIDPDLKYIASRLRLTPAANSSGSSSALIYILKPNGETWPLANVVEFTTWETITRSTVNNYDDAHAERIDNLPKKWVNDSSVMMWGNEHASDGDHVWDGYVRFNISSGVGTLPRYVDVGGEGGSYVPPPINNAYITMRSAADTSSTTTTIHGINRDVKRGSNGFPQYDTIVAKISQQYYDADLVNGSGWTTTGDIIRFGSSGSNTYNAFLRFKLEDKDDSSTVEWIDYISESYLTVEAYGNTPSGSNAIISRTDGCVPPNFVESTTLIKEVQNAYDDPTYGLSDDADYDINNETWNNKETYVNFGGNYQGFVRIQTSLSNVDIVSATLYIYPQSADLDASDMVVTLTDDTNEDAYRHSGTKSYHTWDTTYPPTLAYSHQVLQTLDPNNNEDNPDNKTVVSSTALLGDQDLTIEHILGGPDTPFANGSNTDTREYDLVSTPAVRKIGDCVWADDGLWVAWVDNDKTPDAPNYKLLVSRYDPVNEEWLIPHTIDSEVYGEISMLTINNLACVCYIRERSGEEEIYFARQDGTGTWQTPVEVVGGFASKTIGSPHCIDIDPNNGTPAVYYVYGDAGSDTTNQIYEVTSSDGGYTWGTPTNIGVPNDSAPYNPTETIEHDCLRAAYVDGEVFVAYSRYVVADTQNQIHFAYNDGLWNDGGLVGSIKLHVSAGFDLIAYHDGQSDNPVVPLFIGRNTGNPGIRWAFTADHGSTWFTQISVAAALYDHNQINVLNIRAALTEEDGFNVVNIAWTEDEGVAGTTFNAMLARQMQESLWVTPAGFTWSQLKIAGDIGSDAVDTIPVSNIRNRAGYLILQPNSSPSNPWDSAPVFYWLPRAEYKALIRWYAEEPNFANDYLAPFSNALFVDDSFLAVLATDDDNFDMSVSLLDSGFIQPWTTYGPGYPLPDTISQTVFFSPTSWSASSVHNPSMGDSGGIPALWQEWSDLYGQLTYSWIGIQIAEDAKTDRAAGVEGTDNVRGLVTSFTFNPAGTPVSAGGTEGLNYTWTYPERNTDANAPDILWSIGTNEWQGASAIGVDVTDLVDYFVNGLGSTGYMGFMIYDANPSSGSVKTFYSVENGSSVPYLEVVYSSSPSVSYSGSVAWSPDAWTEDEMVVSPDIRSIVQSFVDSCNPDFYDIALAIRHSSGSVLKTFVAYDGSGYGESALLTVEYSSYIDVTPFSPDISVSWTTGTFSTGVEYNTPDLRTIFNAWLENFNYNPATDSFIGFRIHTNNDELIQVDSQNSGYSIELTIEYSPQHARNKWDNNSVSWVSFDNWDSTTPTEIISPDLMDLIDVLFEESYDFRYDYDPYGQGSNGVGYYLDDVHTSINTDFAGHEIGFVIKDNGSAILREFESYDNNPSASAILEIDLTEVGPRNRYMIDSATEHAGVDWTASGWAMGASVDTTDITELIEEYLQLPDYDQTSGSYMGIVFENNSGGNPIKSFRSYDSSYGGAELTINWTTGGALPPTGSAIQWTPVDSFSTGVPVNTADISELVGEFLSKAGYTGSGYIGFEISDDGTSSDIRSFYSYESGSDPAELFIHYSGPERDTVGSVLWNSLSTPILGSWSVDETVSTPELSTLVQSYIELTNYTEAGGYYIGFIIEDNNSDALKSIYSYETAGGTDAAQLYVSYRSNFDFTVELNSLATSRLCLGPGESSDGTLDLTPRIRVDSYGQQVVETPLLIEYLPNWTYFAAIEATTDDGSKVILDQKTSVSCLTCNSNAADSTWDYQTCSLTVKIPNNNLLPKNVNVAVQIFSDEDRNDLAVQLSTFPWGDVRQFTMEDNQPAQNFMDNGQFTIAPGEILRMLAWPPLDPNEGLLCGIKYYYTVLINDEGGNIPDQVVTSGNWTCNCNSGRWADRYEESQQNLQTIQRWRSSGEGLVDTRLTETKADNFNPTIQIRPDNAGIVLYESTRDGNYGIYASAFSYRPSFKMYASAAESIISPFNQLVHRSDIPVNGSDGNPIAGINPDFSFDLYGNVFMTTTMPFTPTLTDGNKLLCNEFVPDSMNFIKVHRCGLDDFSFEDVQQDAAETICIQEDITREVYSIGDPIFNKLIRLVRVKEEFVKYHVTRSRAPIPVVDQCRISLEIVGSPESVAVRLRNGTSGSWGKWLPFSPETGSETIEVDHILRRGSGVKEIQVQVASVAGVVPTATIIVLGDFKPITHSVNFYKPIGDCDTGTPCSPDEITPEDLSNSNIWQESNKLNMSENIPIASVRHPELVKDGDDSNLVFRDSEYIFIEIVPESTYFQQFTEKELSTLDIAPTFDFIQQGGKDEFNLPTTYVQGENVFRGWITINKEDKGSFRDGLASIVVHFKDDCSDPASVSASTITERVSEFNKDKFNSLVPGTPSSASIKSDPFAGDRDQFGQIKSKISIRPVEDPYFVFGDPNYRLKTNE